MKLLSLPFGVRYEAETPRHMEEAYRGLSFVYEYIDDFTS